MSFSQVPGYNIVNDKLYQAHLNKLVYLRNLSRVTDNVGNYLLANINERLDDNNQQMKEYYEKNAMDKLELSLVLNGTLKQGFSQLSENITESFSEMSDYISELGEKLDSTNENLQELGLCLVELNNLLDWKTDRIIECQNKTNIYLSELIDASLKAEEEKQIKYYTGRSFDFLNSAIKEGPDSRCFKNSMELLIKIEAIDKWDFISLFQKGVVYTLSIDLLNIDEAIVCFNNAMYYANVNLSANFKTSKNEISEEIIRSSNFYLSTCFFVKNDFVNALLYAEKAYALMPMNPIFCIRLAKMLCVNKKEVKALEYLQKAIDLNPKSLNDIIDDDDIISNQIIKDYIKNKVFPLIEQVKDQIMELRRLSIPETKEFMEVENLFTLFNNSYVSARNCLHILVYSNIEIRVKEIHQSFLEACKIIQDYPEKIIESINYNYDKSQLKYENDYKSEVKLLGYVPEPNRFYIEHQYLENKRKVYHTFSEEKFKNANKLKTLFRITNPLSNKIMTFDFCWLEWVHLNDFDHNKQTSICKLDIQAESILAIKRNLNQYGFYSNYDFGFSISIITTENYFVEIGFSYYIEIYDPLSLFKKYSNGHFPINISNMFAQKIKNEIGKISYKEVMFGLDKLREKIKKDFNQHAIKSNHGFKLKNLFFHGEQRYTFKNFKLERVSLNS